MPVTANDGLELDVPGDHPLSLELASLRAALARFQQEAHNSSLKLQRQSLDVTNALERLQILERENARLSEEIAVLRVDPDPSEHQRTLSSQELALALRRVSEKLDLTEASLLARTTELTHARSDLHRAKTELNGAYELASKLRAREEEGQLRENELRRRFRAVVEERRMSDLVISEYADLVRSLESRLTPPSPSPSLVNGNDSHLLSTSASSTTLVDSLAEGKTGLQKLFQEYTAETGALEGELRRAHEKLALSESRCAAERESSEQDRAQLAQTQFELEKLRLDDNTAAEMVSQYMKYSQATVNSLQSSLAPLQTRHAATISTLTSTVDTLRHSLSLSQRTIEKLRAALDELSADIAREVYGRRREIALRLGLTAREERVAEHLRRWTRKAEELFDRSDTWNVTQIRDAFNRVVQDASGLLEVLNGDVATSEDALSAGSLARIIVAQSAVALLSEELYMETQKRMSLERRIVVAEGGEDVQETNMERAPDPLAPNPPDNTETPPRSPQTAMSHDNSPFIPPLADRPISQNQDDVSGESSLTLTSPASREISLDEILDENTRNPLESADHPAPISAQQPSTASSERYSSPPLGDQKEQSTPEADSVPSNSPADLLPIAPNAALDSSHNGITPRCGSPENALEASPVPKHPLISELAQASHRYDDLQCAFRDCEVALQDLKASMIPSESGTQSKSHSSLSVAGSQVPSILQVAIERLDDYTEDTRVELEIRAADEALLARGYEALLSIPDALSPSTSLQPIPKVGHQERQPTEQDIKAFIDGTEYSVQKVVQTFSAKLEDIQHDIAAIKRVMHDSDVLSGLSGLVLDPSSNSSSVSVQQAPLGVLTSWTAGIFGGSRPSSPAPTFGDVMTTPRLPSVTLSGEADAGEDAFAQLGLRILMPACVSSTKAHTRSRTGSAMSMVGLGIGPRRTSSGGLFVGSLSSSTLAAGDAVGERGGNMDVE